MMASITNSLFLIYSIEKMPLSVPYSSAM